MGEEASRQLILLFPASQMTDNFFYKTLDIHSSTWYTT
jgi:hypothetical protein